MLPRDTKKPENSQKKSLIIAIFSAEIQLYLPENNRIGMVEMGPK